MNKSIYKFCINLIKPFVRIFFPYEVKGLENLKGLCGGYIICSNHLSNLDPILLAIVHPKPINFMAKEELFKYKLIGKFLKMVGVFPVKRGKGDINAINYALEIPKSGGVLGIFLEGTRSKTGEFLRPRSGAALIAGKTNSKVLPVCITGSSKDHKIHIFKKTLISYGEPINQEEIKIENRLELKDSTNLIMDNIKKLRGI